MDSKFYFDLPQSVIYPALEWEKYFRKLPFFKKLFLVLFILSFLGFLYGFLGEILEKGTLSFLLGSSLIFLVLSVDFALEELFFNSKLKRPAIPPDSKNLADYLSLEVAKAINSGKIEIEEDPKLKFIFSRLLLDLKQLSLEKDIEKIILTGLEITKAKGGQVLKMGNFLLALAKLDPTVQKILMKAKLKEEDLKNVVWWLESLERKIAERKKWWEYKNLLKKGSLGKEWAAGYTVTLDRYSIDLTKLVELRGYPEHIGHGKELKALERILASPHLNNALLVGEPGVGKKAVVQGLAVKSALGTTLKKINYKRVVSLDVPAIASQFGPEEIAPVLDKIFNEVISAGNVILVINDFHNYVERIKRPGAVDITGVLSPYLQSPQFQLIGVTTYRGLHQQIEPRPEILSLFEKVEVSPLSPLETIKFLESLVPRLEHKYKVFISYPAIRDIVRYAKRYIPATPFPKKAVNLLETVVVETRRAKAKVVLPHQVAKVVSEKVEVPVGEIEIKEKEILLNLEKLLHQRIIDQEKGVREISSALRRARAQIAIRKGPMGSFLFLGPTGVGKTETSKALAETYFGSEQKMIRLDMSEFQAVKDIPRLIGSTGEEGLLTTPVKENPFSLILLDEIEKAHPNILNLFLQILDEGFITDGLGRKVDFKNTIIIGTSNAGYKIILKAIKEKIEWSQIKQKLLDDLFQRGMFRPEFINRFDAVVIFRPLSQENLLDIAQLMLQKLKKNLKEKGIEFIITNSLKEKMVELGYDPTFGARKMRRVIQDKAENVLASALLSGEIKRGDKVELNPQTFQIIKK